MANNSILDILKNQYKTGGMHIQLIGWNLIVFIIIVFARVFSANSPMVIDWLDYIFSLQSNLGLFITRPWGLLTSIFSHFGFLHFLSNMIFLYFSGVIFLQFFSGKRLLYTYIFGGIFGGIVQIIIGFFPGIFAESGALVVGASGSIMAIFLALAIHKPEYKVNLFGVLPVPLYLIGLLFVLKDFSNIGTNDGIAHFVHLGGALFGYLSVRNYPSSKNLVTVLIKNTEGIIAMLKSVFFGGKKLRKVSNPEPARKVSDEKFNENKKMTQEQVDIILDKISRSGYDSLTKAEKEFLFKQSSR